MEIFKIEKNDTKLFDFDTPIWEPCDPSHIQWIINSVWNRTYTDCEDWMEDFHITWGNARQHLSKIKKKITSGHVMVQTKVNEFGRANFKNHISLAVLPADIKALLAILNDLTIYDIENAQPAIFYELLKMVNTIDESEYKNLSKYIKNRDSYLELIAKHFFNVYDGETRKKVKILIIRVCFFGGSYKKWCKENDIHTDQHKFITSLKKEIETLNFKYVVTQNKEIYDEVAIEINKEYKEKMDAYNKWKKSTSKKKIKNMKKPKEKRPEITLFCRFLQNWERKIIEYVLLQLIDQEKIRKNHFVYEYDGFMVTRNDELLTSDIETMVKEKFGFHLTFTTKEPTAGHKLKKEIEELEQQQFSTISHPEEALKSWNRKYFRSIQCQYRLQKDYFEKFFCFTEDEANYWFCNNRIDSNHDSPVNSKKNTFHISTYNWKQLKDSRGTYMTSEWIYPENGGDPYENEMPFVDRWLKDVYKKTYDRMVFEPQNIPYEDISKDKNLFNSFSGYPAHIFKGKS